MIERLRHLSIRVKLRLMLCTVLAVALLMACFAFVGLEFGEQHEVELARNATLAEVMTANLASALVFQHADAAVETLAALRVRQDIHGAAVYSVDGYRLAYFSRDPDAPPPRKAPPRGNATLGEHRITVTPVMLDDERVGTLYLQSAQPSVGEALLKKALLSLVVLVVCSVIALMIGDALASAISRPILSLVETARAFSLGKNTRIRARKYADDELGMLVDRINEMLERIEHDTELRSRNEELRLENARVEEVAQARALFLANMSHEIRTPMTAILGYIELIADSGTSVSERDTYTEIIRRNGRHLLDLINDILDLSKIESGRLDVEMMPVQLADLVYDAAETVRVKAAEKGLAFSVEFEGALPVSIETDPTRLRQILTNLLGNAVKFTTEGSVQLRVGLSGAESEPKLEFEVLDTGIGIPEAQLSSVFDPFAQADDSTTRRFGGTGLGLAICWRLAARLGGSVSVSSEPGQGSSFLLQIDPGLLDGARLVEQFEPRTAEPEVDDLSVLTGTGRILVAEDGIDNQRLVRAFLERAGYQVEVVGTGTAAVETALDAWAREEPFELILMDIHMPQLDGYGATRRLRSEGYDGPIVALTARAMKGEREECLAAGCDDYASKPIDRVRLLTLAEKYTRSD